MLLKDFDLFFPESFKEAQDLLRKLDGAVIFGGGTFSLPLFKKSSRIPEGIISLKNIPDLKCVRVDNNAIHIGSMVTLSDCAQDASLKKLSCAFCESIQNIATAQIRNRATVGGNVCSCLPWADLPYVLLALDAALDFGGRPVAMRDFLNSPKIVLENNILREVIIPFKTVKKFILIRMPRLNTTDISLCAACIVEASDALVVTANIGNSYPRRFERIEKYLKDSRKGDGELLDKMINQELDFQKDAYRREMLAVCLKRVVEQYDRT